VVTTYPRHEKVVAGHLQLMEIESFLPLARTPSRWKDRTVMIDRPIFPGYVFTRIDLRDRRHVFSISSVVKMLSFNGAPAPIEDAEIDAVRLCLRCGTNLEPHPFLQVGEKVRVKSGALSGLEGIVTRHKNQYRILVSIALIHQSVAVEVDAHMLEPVGNLSHRVATLA
jgi:transcription antitermination factor NusG